MMGLLHETELAMSGEIFVFERPDGMPMDDFMRPGIGILVARACNVVLNQFWADLLAIMGNSLSTALACTGIAIGTGALGGGPLRTDTALVAEWKRYSLYSATASAADPPSATLSFLAAGADGAATITECGLLYAGASPAGGKVATHAALTWAKSNIDTRIDYPLARSVLT